MNHVHHDLIVAWAKGAKIEWYDDISEGWEKIVSPTWAAKHHYRIKSEPKPDVVLYGMVCLCYPDMKYAHIQKVNANTEKRITDTCKFTFDGETGKLKSAEVL